MIGRTANRTKVLDKYYPSHDSLGERVEVQQRAFRTRRVLALVALAGVALLYVTVGVAVAWPLVAPTPMAIFAHRGDMSHWPENTLESVRAASRTAADGIEFDVRLSADGTWWLLHDPTLDKMTSATGDIGSHTDSELSALTIDGGPGYFGQPSIHLAQLSSVLDELRSYDGKLVIDVKEDAPEAHAAIARIMRGRPDSYVLCRSIPGASAVKAVDPGLTTILLTNDVWHPDVDVYLADAREVPTWWTSILTDAGGTLAMFVNADTGAGLPDERALIETGRRWGVAFVISNRIDAALASR
jgi:glycerophosphoryl diester phosphodiesterase